MKRAEGQRLNTGAVLLLLAGAIAEVGCGSSATPDQGRDMAADLAIPIDSFADAASPDLVADAASTDLVAGASSRRGDGGWGAGVVRCWGGPECPGVDCLNCMSGDGGPPGMSYGCFTGKPRPGGPCHVFLCDGREDCRNGEYCLVGGGTICSPMLVGFPLVVACHSDCDCPPIRPRCDVMFGQCG